MRVLALTHNASLLVALGSMMREWEVVSARDVEAALKEEPGSAVALIDFGDTQEGLKAATELYQQGVTIPAVVLGDEPAEGAIAFVLVRPFSLEDLATAVTEASTRPASAPPRPAKVEPPPAPPPAKETRADANGGAPASKARSEPAPPREEPASKPQKSRPLSVVPPAEAPREAPKVAPPPPRPAAPTPAPTSQAPSAPPRVEPAKPKEEQPEPEQRKEPAARAEQARPAESARPAAPEPPAPRVESPPPQRSTVSASSAATAPELEMEPEQAQGRWRLRRKPAPRGGVAESAESPVVRQLKQAAKNAADLETLVEELPFLSDLNGMADGLVAEVEAQFSTQVASVFVRRQDGYHVIAHRGLSRVESGMVVPETQPLFSDVLQTGEGILIQPVDLAQGLVAGIGGARTEALMAVPAVVHGACVAIIIAGHSRFGEVELDRLSELASEAAPGLAVALALARLRERI